MDLTRGAQRSYRRYGDWTVRHPALGPVVTANLVGTGIVVLVCVMWLGWRTAGVVRWLTVGALFTVWLFAGKVRNTHDVASIAKKAAAARWSRD